MREKDVNVADYITLAKWDNTPRYLVCVPSGMSREVIANHLHELYGGAWRVDPSESDNPIPCEDRFHYMHYMMERMP